MTLLHYGYAAKKKAAGLITCEKANRTLKSKSGEAIMSYCVTGLARYNRDTETVSTPTLVREPV